MSNILNLFDTVSASEEGAWLHLRRPDNREPAYLDEDQERPVRIKLKGPDSDTWTEFQRKALRGGKDNKTLEETVRHDAKLMARMTLDFENIPDDDEEDGVAEYSFENAYKLHLDYKDIRMQAYAFINDQQNFTSGQRSD